ncbi:MAG: NADP-dependent oxidoreductase [Alphaproteobacteria bacterium]
MAPLTVDARRFVLAQRPRGLPAPDDFAMQTATLGPVDEGQVLARTLYCSVDPGMRSRLNDTASYAQPIAIGGVIDGANVGEVLASGDGRFVPGDLVVSGLGWQDHVLAPAKLFRKLPETGLPPSAAIGVLGIPGMTAYFGLYDVGGLRKGQVVLVSSAAGPVGATAGQIAKLEDCLVIGIAGGPEKCRWLTEELGFDAAIDYRETDDITGAVQSLTPKGVDIYFDNVGNAMVDAVLPTMRAYGRIVVSGQVADYNAAPGERAGIHDTQTFITHRLRMEGLVVFDYAARFPEAITRMAGWIHEGRLKYREEIIDGFESLPDAFIGLFRGENFGRRLVKP